MKLFYAPGACSIGIHVVLEELGAPYEAERVDIRADPATRAALNDVNPKSKVPTLLRDDGSVLTEYGAISHWLTAGTALAPQGREVEARVIEVIDYVVATVHMQGFTRMFRPGNFAPGAADEDWVKQRGRQIATAGFAWLAAKLGEADYLFGAFSHADAALFYVERWGGRVGIDLPPALAAHLDRMMARPAVARVLAAEGLA
jgi:glutathione S-transferase